MGHFLARRNWQAHSVCLSGSSHRRHCLVLLEEARQSPQAHAHGRQIQRSPRKAVARWAHRLAQGLAGFVAQRRIGVCPDLVWRLRPTADGISRLNFGIDFYIDFLVSPSLTSCLAHRARQCTGD